MSASKATASAPEVGASRRAIPSVDRVVEALRETQISRPLVVEVVRRQLGKMRVDGALAPAPGRDIFSDAISLVRDALEDLRRSRIQPLINATGIIVHTNFGRSPLAPEAVAAMSETALHYTNLEYDCGTGTRGVRAGYLEQCLALLCGAPEATIVNNCAAALILALRNIAGSPPRNQVIISRGELVQIGGGFRIPEILEASGASLCEVGTTNQTTTGDYLRAINERTALILKVHYSNFYMGGFVGCPSMAELSAIAREAEIPLLQDLGSGATFDTTSLGGDEREPTPRQALAAGADLVCFSGDKLLGGPQAGIIAGALPLVRRLRQDPLFRAMRCDKLILSALQATTELLLSDQAGRIPIRQMMEIDLKLLQDRADALAALAADLPVVVARGEGRAQVGGGSLPRTVLPSVTLDVGPRVAGHDLQEFSRRLRLGTPPVVGYIEKDRLKLDLRTVFPAQDAALLAALRRVAVEFPL